MMHALTDSAGAMSAASAVHLNIFGPMPIVVSGTEAQKKRFLPPLIAGEEVCCFGVTEPDAGLDTSRIATFCPAGGEGLPRRRTQDVDLDRAGRGQDPAAGPDHAP